jgi:hypothetical protein
MLQFLIKFQGLWIININRPGYKKRIKGHGYNLKLINKLKFLIIREDYKTTDNKATKFLPSSNLSVTFLRIYLCLSTPSYKPKTLRIQEVGNRDNICEIILLKNRIHITVVYIYWNKL